MYNYVRVVSAPSADTPGVCLLLHFDSRRYFFGRVAEGTQRLLNQRTVSLMKATDIFLSGRIDWSSTGGLLGMFLTLAEIKGRSDQMLQDQNEKARREGKKEVKYHEGHVNVHGGKNLVHMLASARRFIFRKAMPVCPREVRRDPRADGNKRPDYEDENIRVWSIPASIATENSSSNAAAAAAAVAQDSDQSPPRKRKRTEDSTAEGEAENESTSMTDEEADQHLRESVVKDMFGSHWSLDTLREMKLSQVKLPAKIFVKNEKGELELYNGPLPDGTNNPPDINVFVRLPWPASRVEKLPKTEPSKETMCYVVKNYGRRGKFDVTKADELGVPKQHRKFLANGQNVTGKDGITVTPDMVLGPSVPAAGFAILDIPSLEYIDAVLARPEWADEEEIVKGVHVAYWILGDGVDAKDERIQAFMKAHSSWKHIVFSKSLNPNVIAMMKAADKTIRMHHIDPDRYPLPVYDNNGGSLPSGDGVPDQTVGVAGHTYLILPRIDFPTDNIIPPMNTKWPSIDLVQNGAEILALAQAGRERIASPEFQAEVARAQQDLPLPDTEIIPLGTGSSIPSNYRNVSANLVRIPGWGSLILDCGENTLGQLRRLYGYAGADEVLRDLRAIYISHSHADHHLGTVAVIDAWLKATSQREETASGKLAIIAAPKYQAFIREFHQVQPLGLLDRVFPVTLGKTDFRHVPGRVLEVYNSYNVPDLPKIEPVLVDHCYEAAATIFTFDRDARYGGLKIAYSGDCRPSAEFASVGRGAHLLIHECTFEDGLQADALAKKHSTLSEALAVGRDMQARRILLTHFSQRYPQLPAVSKEVLQQGQDGDRDVEVLFAFDLMRVRLGEFKHANAFLPALRKLYEAEEPEEVAAEE